MMVIWKYVLRGIHETIEMPKDAQILSVHSQHGDGCLWALVNPDSEKEERTFHTFGTGWEIDIEQLIYIGTFHLHGGTRVFHVFEESTN